VRKGPTALETHAPIESGRPASPTRVELRSEGEPS
jgi:hypothetical protein